MLRGNSMKIFLQIFLLLLLLPSLAYGAAEDSYWQTPATGASSWTVDNAALEQSGNSYFACGVMYQQNNTGVAGVYPSFIGKYLWVGNQRSWLLYRDTVAGGNDLVFYFDKLGTDATATRLSSPNNYDNDTNKHSIVAQWFGNGPTNSGATMWASGNRVATVSNSSNNNIFAGTARLSIGSQDSGEATNCLNGRIYQVWIAYSDTPIITADSNVTAWSQNPGTTKLPFNTGGVSRYYVWGPAGRLQWINGTWQQTASPVLENFTDGWVETDAAAYVTPYASSVAFTALPSNASAYLVNDYGASFFGTSFSQTFRIDLTATTGSSPYMTAWGISNHAATDPASWTDGIVLLAYGDPLSFAIYNKGSLVLSPTLALTGVSSANLVITRDATNTTYVAYDLSGVSLASGAVASGATPFRYEYVTSSYNGGVARTITGTLSNLNLWYGNYDMDFVGNPIAHLEELQPIRKTRSGPLRSRSGGWSAREFPIP